MILLISRLMHRPGIFVVVPAIAILPVVGLTFTQKYLPKFSATADEVTVS